MIKRTPQEIADFFGGYVFQGRDRDSFYMTKGKPGWNGADFTLHCDGMLSLIDKAVVAIPADHDWTHLYEPQNITPESGIINEKSDENCQKSDLCPHSDEVYTHKEYRIVTAHKEIDSESFSKGVMAWIERGWVPSGGISFDKQGCPYQALVRGV